jgi:hypothetical protein
MMKTYETFVIYYIYFCSFKVEKWTKKNQLPIGVIRNV